MLSKKQKKIIFSVLGVLVVAGILFFLFSKEGVVFKASGESEELKRPKEIVRSPFSGVPCNNNEARAFAVVLAQYPETMPLSSPSQADIVIEGPVANAGGVSRLIAIFQCQEPKEIGSIRSVRPYMADIALGYDTIFASWGGCEKGIERIKEIGLNWLDARQNPSAAFFRKQNIASPHNGFTSFEGLKKASQSLGMRQVNQFEGYQFVQPTTNNLQPTTSEIDINYYYPVKWVYEPESGNYLRYWNNKEMIDRNTAKQVTAKNVVLMKTDIGVLSEGVADVRVIGSGKALVYQDGKEIEATWKKESPKAKLAFFDKEDKEIKFIPGPIWIEIVD